MAHLALIIPVAVLSGLPLSAADLPGSLDLTRIRGLTVQHDGRWPPLDTVARDIVEEVTGNIFYQGRDPVLLLLAWTFDPATWMEQPIIPIKNAELRGELQLPSSQTVFSYKELTRHPHLRSLTAALGRVRGERKLDPLESKVSEINGQLTTLHQVFSGEVIKPIPDPENPIGTWGPFGGAGVEDSGDADGPDAAWAAAKAAFLADDDPAFQTASEQLVAAVEALPAAHRPAAGLIATELRYNRLRPFRSAWMVMVVGALLYACALVIRRKWFDAFAVVGLIAGFGILTYGLSMRWEIAGRIPAANMFESLLFLSWGMGAFAVVAMLFLRHRIVPLTASVMGALALFLADVLPLDHYVRPAPPVLLDTVWMSIHVPIIMVSYSVLALGVLFAHVQLVAMAVAPGRRRFPELIDSLHYWYIHVGSLLLLAGIITGSMWAASSWGRYWGWDPKEVWSLIAFLGYLVVLHVRIDRERVPWWAYAVALLLGAGVFVIVIPKLAPLTGEKVLSLVGAIAAMAFLVLARGRFATAMKSILCFWLVIMTYVGVNYVLGTGLHSYGFGTGAMTHYLFLIGGLDLSLIAICCLVYLALRARGVDHVLQPLQRGIAGRHAPD